MSCTGPSPSTVTVNSINDPTENTNLIIDLIVVLITVIRLARVLLLFEANQESLCEEQTNIESKLPQLALCRLPNRAISLM